MTDIPAVRQATDEDAPSIAAVLDAAFRPDKVSLWVMGSPTEVAHRQLSFFLPFVEYVLAQQQSDRGEVQIRRDNGEYAGAALWLDLTGQGDEPGPDMAKIAEALGEEGFERFMVLDELMHKHHPVGMRHAYLPFIGVTPHRQSQGIGQQLLRAKLAKLDEAGVPAYLEATSRRSRDLYQKYGFELHGAEVTLPDGGPPLWPMRRQPDQYRSGTNSRWAGWPS